MWMDWLNQGRKRMPRCHLFMCGGPDECYLDGDDRSLVHLGPTCHRPRTVVGFCLPHFHSLRHYLSNIKCLKWKSERFFFFKKKKTLKFANDLTTTVKVVVLSISKFFSTCIYGLLKLELFFDAIKKKVHYALLTCICSIIILFYIQ